MAACGSLQHIFEKPLPENQTLLESLSPWNQIKNNPNNIEQSSSFTEIFGELHFKENSLFQTPIDHFNPKSPKPNDKPTKSMDYYTIPASKYGSHKNCTEGLGFESSDEVEPLVGNSNPDTNNNNNNNNNNNICPYLPERKKADKAEIVEFEVGKRRSRVAAAAARRVGGFPPPISSLMGKSGKAGVCFESFREDGRFVLKEIRVRRQEFLHACREDGRLKLHFVHQPNYDDGIAEEDGAAGQEEEEENDDVEGEIDEEEKAR